jgi:hypothetical protein
MRALPDAPSLKELGFSMYSSSPYGLLAPKETPKEVVETIYLAAKKVVENHRAVIADRLDKLGAEIGLEGPEEYAISYTNYVAAVKYLKTHPLSTGKIGVVGFCWGGGMANQVAVNSPDVLAVVPYYGMQPASEDVPKIKASCCCIMLVLMNELIRGFRHTRKL